MIPFRLVLQTGVAPCQQVAYAAKKAMMAGQMRPGDPFPSVREISKAFKINPNTAHKVVSQLMAEGLLEVRPGIGTVVAAPAAGTAAERRSLLKHELEELVVEAKKLGLSLADVTTALEQHWELLDGHRQRTRP